MRVISYNVNGIRAALKKGFAEWMANERPDVLCLQETKATQDQVDVEFLTELGYHHYWFSAQKKGYSGVAIFCKQKPVNVVYGTSIDYMDFEGRNLRIDFEGVSIMSMYLPSGTNLERLDLKLTYMDDLLAYLTQLREQVPNLVVCGDYNICHTAKDIHDPIRNAKVSGFLPEERAWMDDLVASGFIDSFRAFNTEPHQYSWWSYRANSRANNKGWRLDYHMVSQPLKDRMTGAGILQDVVHSDHCPVWLELDV